LCYVDIPPPPPVLVLPGNYPKGDIAFPQLGNN
jgi:hypothetical protein